MTNPTTLITIGLAAALATGCAAFRTTTDARVDERIVIVPPSAGPVEPPARGILGTVIHKERATHRVTLRTPEGEMVTVQLPPVTAALLREGDTTVIDPSSVLSISR